jgi:tetratricopeptide (TPR) repeat protein
LAQIKRWNVKLPAGWLLVCLVIAVYYRVSGYPFVDLDDQIYVFGNPVVGSGLTLDGFRWAFVTFCGANWHPVTWLSHMTDVSLFGMDPGKHHLVSLLFHAANSVLLFVLIKRMTARQAESWIVAALFAIHPLHVESVAWISERKDVLCAFFFLLTLLAYARYREKPGAWRYGAVVFLYAMALMSKPMAVTLPFVLLLLDVWPLRAGFSGRLILEKIPLFLMSAASSLVTFLAQSGGEAVAPADFLSPGARLVNSTIYAVDYLRMAAWPSRLSVFYPIPRFGGIPAKWIVASMVLGTITSLAVWQIRKRPWLAIGWFWYLGMLVPVVGIVQVGMQGMADRYTYLPLIGIFIAAVWEGRELTEASGIRPAVAGSAILAVIAMLSVSAWSRVGCWSDSVRLFQSAAEAVPGNWLAHRYLGIEAARLGRTAESLDHIAIVLQAGAGYNDFQYGLFREHGGADAGAAGEMLVQFEKGIRSDAEALRDVGLKVAGTGRLEDAVFILRQAVRLWPGYPEGHYDLAIALGRLGREQESLPHFRYALRIAPVDPESNNRIGVSLVRLGRAEASLPYFRATLRQQPGYGDAMFNLAIALDRIGRREEAIKQLREYLAGYPGDMEARARLGEWTADPRGIGDGRARGIATE